MKYRAPTPADLDRLTDLEQRSYPPDEAASRETLAYRIENAVDYFTLAEDDDGALVGFVCGTLSAEDHLTEESMAGHDAAGSSLCIHSVVVEPTLRRGGHGLALVRAYVERTRARGEVARLLLICKEHLIGFYERSGFELLGPSSIVHGADPWFAMRREAR